MGIAYGFASEPPHVTNALLRELSSHIVDQGSGPRCMVGDFNLVQDQIELWQYWMSQGFIEAQDLWAVRTGSPPKVTCKNKTRKDYILLSPELA